MLFPRYAYLATGAATAGLILASLRPVLRLVVLVAGA